MKIIVEIECTPEEARSFMGLPDVTPANNIYIDNITKAMKGASDPRQLQEYAQALAPMGQVGLKLFQGFMGGSLTTAASGEPDGSGKKGKAPPGDD